MNTPNPAPRGISRSHPLLRAGLAVLAFTALPAAGQSLLCGGGRGNENRQMPLQVGTLSVGPDVPLGSVVYRQRFDRPPGATIQCSMEARRVYNPVTRSVDRVFGPFVPAYRFELGTPPRPLSDWNQGPYAGKVHLTDVPGLGVVYVRADTGQAFPSSMTGTGQCTVPPSVGSAHSCAVNIGNVLAFDLLLIKIGDVGAGSLSGASLPQPTVTIKINDMTDQQALRSVVTVSGSISLMAATCSTSDVMVNLGSHGTAVLASAQSSPWTDFSIRLQGCPAFTGTFTEAGPVWAPESTARFGAGNGNHPLRGSFSRAGTAANSIMFRIDPTAPALDTAAGVLNLDAAPHGSNTATGVGVQIANAQAVPLALGVPHPSGLQPQPRPQSYAIPLRARYVRGTGPLAPGPANATATFTLIYR